MNKCNERWPAGRTDEPRREVQVSFQAGRQGHTRGPIHAAQQCARPGGGWNTAKPRMPVRRRPYGLLLAWRNKPHHKNNNLPFFHRYIKKALIDTRVNRHQVSVWSRPRSMAIKSKHPSMGLICMARFFISTALYITRAMSSDNDIQMGLST